MANGDYGSFLGFPLLGAAEVAFEIDVYEDSIKTGSRSWRTAGTDAMAMRWTFRLAQVEDEGGSMNMGGILFAHKVANRRRAFAWPGDAIQPLGHMVDVADKTITADADNKAEVVRVVDGLNLKVGRLVQMPGVNRVHVITGIAAVNPLVGVRGATNLTINPPLRKEVKMNDKMVCKPVPHVLYDPDAVVYRGAWADRMADTKIVLIES